MNTTIKIALSFVLGATISGFVTYKIVEKNFYKELDKAIEDELASFKKILSNYHKLDRSKNWRSKFNTESWENIISNIVVDYDDIEKYEVEPPTYAGEYDVSTDDVTMDYNADDEYHPKDDDEEPPIYDRRITPYLISSSEYAEDTEYFDKETLYYYDEDDTLANSQEEVISDVESYIGLDSLHCFGENPEDPDVIYVRNERNGIDYEVIALHKSYAEEVLGMRDE